MNRRLRGIIVGTGRAGVRLHYGSFTAAGAEITAFADVNLEQARQAGRDLGVAGAYGSLEEAIAAERPDFVSICSPPQLHFAHACVALKAGCHVLVEKPFAETLQELHDLKRVADDAKRTVCVVHNFRFTPGILQAVEAARSGGIGDVIHIARYMTYLHERVRMMEPGHWAQGLPGGRLFEANPHNLYIAYILVGKMKLLEIAGTKSSSRWPHAMIDGFSAVLRGKGGAIVDITMSLNLNVTPHQPGWPEYMLIIGTNGALFVDYTRCVFLNDIGGKPQAARPLDPRSLGVSQLVRALAAKPAAGARGLLRRFRGNGRTATPKAAPTTSTIPGDWMHSGHGPLVEQFVGHIEGRYPEPPVSWEEAFEVQRLNDEMGRAVEASMQTA